MLAADSPIDFHHGSLLRPQLIAFSLFNPRGSKRWRWCRRVRGAVRIGAFVLFHAGRQHSRRNAPPPSFPCRAWRIIFQRDKNPNRFPEAFAPARSPFSWRVLSSIVFPKRNGDHDDRAGLGAHNEVLRHHFCSSETSRIEPQVVIKILNRLKPDASWPSIAFLDEAGLVSEVRGCDASPYRTTRPRVPHADARTMLFFTALPGPSSPTAYAGYAGMTQQKRRGRGKVFAVARGACARPRQNVSFVVAACARREISLY